MDEQIISMKRLAEARGHETGVAYAEGLRQYLGHTYPRDNLIPEELMGFARQLQLSSDF